jgi:cytochrome c556
LQVKLPQGFTQLGPQVHIGFEEIADEAATMGDAQVVLQRLAELQKLCIQCHAIYRLERK